MFKWTCVVVGWFALLFLASCFPAHQGGGGFESKVAYIEVKPTVATRRVLVQEPLRVVIGPKVQDSFTISPSEGMTDHYSQFRRTLSDALVAAFSENFTEVTAADAETRQGLELLVLQADVQQTHTIKYQVVLVDNGNEVLDFVGESEGMTIAMQGDRGSMQEKYAKAVNELAEHTLRSFCEQVYNGVMRDEKLEKQGFWEQRTEAAPDSAQPPQEPTETTANEASSE